MRIVIDIPDKEIPINQEIIDISLHFIGGTLCECDYPFDVLPKGHGRLIDADAYIEKTAECHWLDDISVDEFNKITPTIIEADRETE